ALGYTTASIRVARFILPFVGWQFTGGHVKWNWGPDDKPFLFCPVRKPQFEGESPYQYIHSKVFIIDDKFCTIGSMNNNFRSTTHDSEISIGFYQPGAPDQAFPKRLRMKLWSRHLGLGSKSGAVAGDPAESDFPLIADPVEAIDDLWNKVQTRREEIVLADDRQFNERRVLPNVE